MVVAETFYREHGLQREWFNPAEVDVERDAKGATIAARLKSDGEPVKFGGIEKMSKSKNNGVDPESLVARHGADAVRLFAMFAAPPDQSLEWSDAGIEGAVRFLRRFWRLVRDYQALSPPDGADDAVAAQSLRRKLHQTIAKVSDDLERRYAFNTAIAANMELANELGRFTAGSQAGYELQGEVLHAMVRMLAPIVPHVAQALWEALGEDGLVMNATWPEADPSALETDEVQLVVQVNGKLRGQIRVGKDISREEIERIALAEENVARHIEGHQVRRVIVVPGRLVNVVVG
jgi:leucyl-tRNA synthetase